MPTPIYVEGYEHQTLSANDFGTTVGGLFHAIINSGVCSIVTGRQGAGSFAAQVSPSAATAGLDVRLNGSGVMVGSFYFKITSGAPATQFLLADTGHGGSGLGFHIKTDGTLLVQLSGAGAQSSPSSVADGAWHRVDYHFNTTANPWTLDVILDGSFTYTQLTSALAADTTTVWQVRVGDTFSARTYTVAFDDYVASHTAADYPLGDHVVYAGVSNADVTHNAGTNVIEANDGTDIGVAPAWSLMDEWPANTTDFVQQVAIGTGNYAEVEFPNAVSNVSIWGVEGFAALFSSGTTANSGTTRVVDSSGNTLVDIYSGDMSESALHYRRAIVAVPGGGAWDATKFNGLKTRVGFSSNVDTQPRWSSLMLQYAAVVIPPATSTTRRRHIHVIR